MSGSGGPWVGTWAVFDADETLVNVVVSPGGGAVTTRFDTRSGAAQRGRWEATASALFLRYEGSEGETIQRHGPGFRHVARRIEDGESQMKIGSAFRLTSAFAALAGAWRVAGEPLVLRSDGSVGRPREPGVVGRWRPQENGVEIEWPSGEIETIDLSAGAERVQPPEKPKAVAPKR